MSSPLVAVVTPVYNGAKFLKEAMDSVQAQTYPNLVHYVLDNASSDATPEIPALYKAARVPVHVQRNPHTLPIADNWNKAVGLVPEEAKYFRILAADDFLAPAFIERTVALAEKHESVVIVGCRLHHRNLAEEFSDWKSDQDVFEGREAIRYILSGAAMLVAHQTIFRRTVLQKRNPFLDASMIACDTDACLSLLREGDWGFVHETLATTREHPDTYTAEVAPLGLQLCEHLALIHRHGAFAFGPERAQRLFRLYRRFYLRKLVKAVAGGGGPALLQRHTALLGTLGITLTASDFLEALVDWPMARLGLSPAWTWNERDLPGDLRPQQA